MIKSFLLFFGFYLLCTSPLDAQKIAKLPKGSLFIIGGGKRTVGLMEAMVSTAKLKKGDYIVVLPMSTSEPDTAYHYFKLSIESLCSNPIVNFNFTKENANNKNWLDSLERSKLIYIAGGDQSRFMEVVINTPVFSAIHKAYANGATIAGTSAGAAVMSRQMITGKELVGDTTYHSTFRKLWDKNLDLQPGLGLMDSVIIDQHFIVRSRYNRLLSSLAKFPTFPCIGIDESTAIIVQGKKITVAGESQVVVMSQPKGLRVTDKGLIKLEDMKFSIYAPGDVFWLK